MSVKLEKIGPSRALFTSCRQDWRTPKEFYVGLNAEFDFDFDPCPVDPLFDGFRVKWGKRNFVNPPFAAIGFWVKKCAAEAAKGNIIVALLPSRTDTKWFHDYCLQANEIRFIRGRLRFDDGVGRATFPSMLVMWNHVS